MLWRSALTAAALAGSLTLAAQPSLATKLAVNNGDEVDGWEIVFPSNITIFSLDTPTLTLDVSGTFPTATLASIQFVQAEPEASPTITFAKMAVDNTSGQPFDSYKEQLFSEVTGNTPAPTIQQSFNLDDPALNVFTRQTVGFNSVTFLGQLNNNQTSELGYDSTGGTLIIDANPVSSGLDKIFEVKNTPSMGGSEIVIPEPATFSMMIGAGILLGWRRRAWLGFI
jgi:hypothetical protein